MINGATPIIGGTYAAPTGGSADALAAFGSLSEMKAIFTGDTEVLTQKSVSFTQTEPKVLSSAPNGYTQAKRQTFLRVPFLLDNGKMTTCTFRGEVSFDTEMTAAEVGELLSLGSQLIGDSDFTSFWVSGILE